MNIIHQVDTGLIKHILMDEGIEEFYVYLEHLEIYHF